MTSITVAHTTRPTVVSRAGRVPLPRGFTLVSGARPVEAGVDFELVGPLEGPVVAVLGGISAGRHVGGHPGDPRPGWWDGLLGRDCPLDPTRCRILSIDYLTGDAITPADQAAALLTVMDALGIPALRALVGASCGGAVGLALAASCPERVGAVLAIGAAHEPHPMATALREIQRRIVRLAAGAGHEREGLALARALAMTTYRSAPEFQARFAEPAVHRRVTSEGAGRAAGVAPYPVMEYLDGRGRSFAERFGAERYLRLSESLDLHHVEPSEIRAPVTLVSIDPDAIAPRWQLRDLHARIPGSALIEVDSEHGHDAFLTDTTRFGAIVSDFLSGLEVAS